MSLFEDIPLGSIMFMVIMMTLMIMILTGTIPLLDILSPRSQNGTMQIPPPPVQNQPPAPPPKPSYGA